LNKFILRYLETGDSPSIIFEGSQLPEVVKSLIRDQPRFELYQLGSLILTTADLLPEPEGSKKENGN